MRAWRAFVYRKTQRADVQAFSFNLEVHLEQLYHELQAQTYRHGPYRTFMRCDPKPRRIAVPSVRDQIVHHLLVAAISPTFDRRFHPHSYASRPGKGVLAAVETAHRWIRDCSDGGRQRCFALRMDVSSYFASVDHVILHRLLAQRIGEYWCWLAAEIIGSYGAVRRGRRCGIPLGNLTSQLFANVYLHELDRCIAHDLRVRRYARYMDDWVVVGRDREWLERIAERCRTFLREQLRLDAPEWKTSLVPVTRGADWLGFVLFPHHRVLRPVTIRRMYGQIRSRVFSHLDGELSHDCLRSTFASYDGLLRRASHALVREHVQLLERCAG